MSFLQRIGFIETPEEERARLAQSPEGSKSHELSKLPVTITSGWVQDLLIELSWGTQGHSHRVVVVPIVFRAAGAESSEGSEDSETALRRRYSGSWECAVVASDHPSYPVGGHRLAIGTAELVRGKQISV